MTWGISVIYSLKLGLEMSMVTQQMVTSGLE